MKGKRLYTFIDADDSVPFSKLKIGEQLRILMRKLTYDPAVELAAEDAVTAEYLQLRADLLDFINKAVDPIRKGNHTNVTLAISGKFAVVLDDVIASKELRNYFHIKVSRPKTDYDAHADILLRLEVKES